VLVLVYVLVTSTVADPSGVRTSGITGVHRLAWTEMDGLEFSGSRWAVAVAHDGRRLRLPMVRPRDLPRLAAVSGGSLRFDMPGDGPPEHAPQTAPPPERPPDPTAGDTLEPPQAPSSAPEGSRPGQPAE